MSEHHSPISWCLPHREDVRVKATIFECGECTSVLSKAVSEWLNSPANVTGNNVIWCGNWDHFDIVDSPDTPPSTPYWEWDGMFNDFSLDTPTYMFVFMDRIKASVRGTYILAYNVVDRHVRIIFDSANPSGFPSLQIKLGVVSSESVHAVTQTEYDQLLDQCSAGDFTLYSWRNNNTNNVNASFDPSAPALKVDLVQIASQLLTSSTLKTDVENQVEIDISKIGGTSVNAGNGLPVDIVALAHEIVNSASGLNTNIAHQSKVPLIVNPGTNAFEVDIKSVKGVDQSPGTLHTNLLSIAGVTLTSKTLDMNVDQVGGETQDGDIIRTDLVQQTLPLQEVNIKATGGTLLPNPKVPVDVGATTAQDVRLQVRDEMSGTFQYVTGMKALSGATLVGTSGHGYLPDPDNTWTRIAADKTAEGHSVPRSSLYAWDPQGALPKRLKWNANGGETEGGLSSLQYAINNSNNILSPVAGWVVEGSNPNLATCSINHRYVSDATNQFIVEDGVLSDNFGHKASAGMCLPGFLPATGTTFSLTRSSPNTSRFPVNDSLLPFDEKNEEFSE